MGVLPLQFKEGENIVSLGLTGDETYDILNLQDLTPDKEIKVIATKINGTRIEFNAIARLDSLMEVAYFQHDGILQYVLRNFLKKNKKEVA